MESSRAAFYTDGLRALLGRAWFEERGVLLSSTFSIWAVRLPPLSMFSLMFVAAAYLDAQLKTPRIETGVKEGIRVLRVGNYQPLPLVLGFVSADLDVLVSYEDPVIPDASAEDISILSWRSTHRGERGFYVQRWHTLSVQYPTGSVSKTHPEAVVQAVVAEYNRVQTSWSFQAEQTGPRRFSVIGHIRGQQLSPLDAVVPAPRGETGNASLSQLARTCSAASTVSIELGTIPLTNLGSTAFEPLKEGSASCRTWIQQIVRSVGEDVVYTLAYDITDHKFFLNIVPVATVRPHV